MRLHIVKSEDTWILKRVAESIRIPGTSVGSTPDPSADVNFYVSYQGFGPHLPGTLNVPWMTHLPAEVDDGGWRRSKFRDCAHRADYCIAMSRNTARHCPRGKTAVWGGAVDPRFIKPTITLGVSAKISRRKCPERIEALQAIRGVDVQVSGGTLPLDQLADWFRGLDYLVVTSDTEGGPYSVLEAIAAGVPVIAPDVGWCWDYPVIRYDGTTEGLVRTVKALRPDPDPWGKASVELEQIFTDMLAGKPILPPDSPHDPTDTPGTFRYRPEGPEMPYFYHAHNCGLRTARRRTERTVELSVADHWLNAVAQASDAPAVEIGAVSPYYWPDRLKTVVDPADKRATVRKSLFECDFSGAAVLCLSTLEHVGESRYGLREQENPLSAFLKLVKESRRFLVSVPYGWASNPSFKTLESFLLVGNDQYLTENGVRVFTVSRRADETWCPSDSYRPYGKAPKPWANTVIFAEKGGLL